VSFFLFAAFCAVAAAAAGVAVERRRDPDGRPGPEGPPDGDPAAGAAARVASPFEGAGLAMGLGDVVSADGAERWLAGAIELREGDHLVAVLFFAPEGARLDVVCAFAAPRRDVLWLSPVPVEVGAEPPSSIELGGVVMNRRARLPVSARRHGQGAPDVGELATFAEYEASARAAGVVLRGPGVALAWSGRRLEPEELDRMGRGDS